MFEAIALSKKFKKGVEYFKKQFAQGTATPPVRRQLADFEREVIDPFDAVCKDLSREERTEIERIIKAVNSI